MGGPLTPTTIMAAYRRTSTADQAYGLGAQTAEIEAEAVRRGWTLRWFQDQASGRSASARPGLQAALAAIRTGECRGLVVGKLDRVARSTRDFLGLWDDAAASGWSLVALNLPEAEPGSPWGRFLRVLFAAVSELEADLISERTREALREARARGVRPGPPSALPPEVTTQIGLLRAQGASYGAIAARLTEQGIPTPAGAHQWHATQPKGHALLLLVVEDQERMALRLGRLHTVLLHCKREMKCHETPDSP